MYRFFASGLFLMWSQLVCRIVTPVVENIKSCIQWRNYGVAWMAKYQGPMGGGGPQPRNLNIKNIYFCKF
jgi:hypothetical protein